MSTPAAYGPAPTPAGAPSQLVPVGNPPPSAGDPDLLPRLSVSSPVDISANVALPAGTVIAFTLPMVEGTLANRPKMLTSVTWVWDVTGKAAFTCAQYLIQVCAAPDGVDPFAAIVAKDLFQYDAGNNFSSAIVRGSYDPEIYVPALQTIVVFVENTNPAADTSMGMNQRVFAQWRLL